MLRRINRPLLTFGVGVVNDAVEEAIVQQCLGNKP